MPILTSIIAGGAWVDSRYAKAADIDALHKAVETLATELKIGQLENRRTVLRGELYQLKSLDRRTPLENRRLADIESELEDVERRLERLRSGVPR